RRDREPVVQISPAALGSALTVRSLGALCSALSLRLPDSLRCLSAQPALREKPSGEDGGRGDGVPGRSRSTCATDQSRFRWLASAGRLGRISADALGSWPHLTVTQQGKHALLNASWLPSIAAQTYGLWDCLLCHCRSRRSECQPSKRTRTRRRQRLCLWLSSSKPPRLLGHLAANSSLFNRCL